MHWLLLILSLGLALQAKGQFTPDDFPVTEQMLRENHGNKNNSGVYSIDNSWFTNKALHQTIVVELYTDFHRMEICLFKNDQIPSPLLPKIGLYKAANNSYELLESEQKRKSVNWFIQHAKQIGSQYFSTVKQVSIGVPKTTLIKIYGQPDSTLVKADYQVLKWTFLPDPALMPEEANSERLFALNSFGHTITAYLKNNQLEALVLFNDIP